MRHGADDPDRLGGWSPFGLTGEGRRQAREAAESLRGAGVERICSSDLPRAMETAEIAAEALGLAVEPMPRFREADNGALAGLPVTEARERYPGLWWSRLEWTQRWPGGESPALFHRRITDAWTDFRAENGGRTTLLVTHGGVIGVILCLERGIPWTNRETAFGVKPAEIIRVG